MGESKKGIKRKTSTISSSKKGAGVILTNSKGKYLLVKGVHTAVWSFPKGHLEKGETFLECAIRECKEETGVYINDYVLINNPFRLSKRNYWYWEGIILNDNVKLIYDKKEATDAGWFTYHEILLLNSNCEVRSFFQNIYNESYIITFNNNLINAFNFKTISTTNQVHKYILDTPTSSCDTSFDSSSDIESDTLCDISLDALLI
jgi:8-oxo-dGTP pyrophosphatase MutT (NUDIX family)